MGDRTKLLINVLLLASATLAVAVAAAWGHAVHPSDNGLIQPLALAWIDVAIFGVMFVLFTVLMVRSARTARVSLGLFLPIALLCGSQYVFSAWLPQQVSILIAALVALTMWRVRRVGVHDLATLLGIAGIAAVLGQSVTPLVACGVLIALSAYDIIAVYRTKHMVALAGRMLETGSVFGFLIPASPKTFLSTIDTALQERRVMMLGSGDVGLPAVLAASAASQSLWAATAAGAGAVAGLALMQWLFTHQKEPAPMAALPPVAMGAILGYLVAMLLNV
jgi:presenilin-like A22 family membrane protease